ncbi:DUF7385 family protein [Halalkalicoccus tibetensis]|uniref:Flagella cluster protein n=1 Tax=Halalkalicoccus tibetensis TaxID=175632 RepID=A0ABD5V3T2_9EURY
MDENDVHAVRHRLKLLRKTAGEERYENRDGVACPACSEPFDELLATDDAERRFDPPDGVGICSVAGDGRLFAFSHRS